MLLNLFYIAIALFALGFSIFIHEFGHFIAAKKRGLVADRFSIGFGPRICGWNWKGTDFRLSLLPLGGYVSLPQLADMGRLEGGEEDEADKLPPVSFADKMIVAVMGAVFNLLFAFLLSLLLWGVGREIVKSTEIDGIAEQMKNVEGEVVPGPAYEAGLRPGDTILEVDGRRVRSWMQFQNMILTGTGRTEDGEPAAELKVRRDGEIQTFTVHPEIVSYASEKMRDIGVSPESDEEAAPIILDLQEGMPAKQAGLQVGDRVLALDGNPVETGGFMTSYLSSHKDQTIEVTVDREGEELVIPVKPKVKEGEEAPRFGFAYDYPPAKVRVHRNPVEQLHMMFDTIRYTLVALLHSGSSVEVKNMSGPVGIVYGLTSMARYGPMDLVWFLALINVNLAILNLLPLPVLDGGHMLFASISKIIGRPLPRVVMEKVQVVFVILLLSFMAYVTFFDVGRVGRAIGLIDDEVAAEQSDSDEATKPDTESDPDGASNDKDENIDAGASERKEP
ncbi:MAG: RIP metalloprotease RseP [Opitutales bacterium]